MIRRALGIDGGLASGAAAVYGYGRRNYPEILAVIDIPTIGEGPERMIDAPKFGEWIVSTAPDICYMERATTMPSIPDPQTGFRRTMGTASMGGYLCAIGAIQATVQLSGLNLVRVMPAVWKRALNLIGENKDGSLHLVRQLHPEVADKWFKRKKDHNRAESVLIALYGCVRCDLVSLRMAAE